MCVCVLKKVAAAMGLSYSYGAREGRKMGKFAGIGLGVSLPIAV